VQDDAPLPVRGLLCSEPAPSTLFHFFGKVAHGLLRDDAAFTSGKGCVGRIGCDKNFRSGALAFFPQGKGFLHRIFFAVEPSALNCLSDECLLVRCELQFHPIQGTEKLCFRQAASWTPARHKQSAAAWRFFRPLLARMQAW